MPMMDWFDGWIWFDGWMDLVDQVADRPWYDVSDDECDLLSPERIVHLKTTTSSDQSNSSSDSSSSSSSSSDSSSETSSSSSDSSSSSSPSSSPSEHFNAPLVWSFPPPPRILGRSFGHPRGFFPLPFPHLPAQGFFKDSPHYFQPTLRSHLRPPSRILRDPVGFFQDSRYPSPPKRMQTSNWKNPTHQIKTHWI